MTAADRRLKPWAAPMLLVLTAAIYISTAGIPALLDDADSLFAEAAREMNVRHDWITPYTNSIRFLEKPPIVFWSMSMSYGLFHSASAFTARLPVALAAVGLAWTTFRIGALVFGPTAGWIAGLALGTCAGLFLFTRIVLPDPILTLWLTLLFYAFLRWDRTRATESLLWMYVFAALAVMTKGLMGAVLPGIVLVVTLLLTSALVELKGLVSWKGVLLFFAIAGPWHVWAAIRNPGFSWFYFVNEHLLRFLGGRYPLDYGTVPVVPFWLLQLVWLFPWSIYVLTLLRPARFKSAVAQHGRGFVLVVVWALTILIFFSVGTSRLEYYTMPAFPAFALLAGRQCAESWEGGIRWPGLTLAIIGAVVGVSLLLVAAVLPAGATRAVLELKDNPQTYIFYLGHLFDLTPESLRALRTPLILAGVSLAVGLPLHGILDTPEAKGGSLAGTMAMFFVAATIALAMFAPRLTSAALAAEINRRDRDQGLIVIDGEYEEGSSIAFYTHRAVLIHNGRSSNLEYGSYYPDAPPLFIDAARLKRLWAGPKRIFLLTFQAKQSRLQVIIPWAKYVLATYGDKLLVSNVPD